MVGATEEELKPNPKPEQPKTPKGKLQNYWYHYKWVTIGGAALLALIIFFIHDMVTKTKYDYEIMFVTNAYVDDEVRKTLENELVLYAEDLNGNGSVDIALDVISLKSADPNMAMANQQKLIANLSVKDKCFYIVDEEVYAMLYDLTKPKKEDGSVDTDAEGEALFAPIDLENESIDKKHNHWNWQGSKLQTDERFKSLPEKLYFGIRDFETKKGEATQLRLDNLALLKNIITDTKTQPVTETTETE